MHQVSGTCLLGPTKSIAETDIFCNSITIGIRFKPGYSGSLFQRNGLALRDNAVQPAPALPHFNYEEVMDLIRREDAFLDYFEQELPTVLATLKPQRHPVVEKATTLLLETKGNIRIGDLLLEIPLSERQLQKIFKREVGLTLKEFATVLRLRSAIIQLELEQEDYQDTVFNSGYFDQAHFIRDFSKLSRISLPDFKKYIRHIRHIGVAYRQ